MFDFPNLQNADIISIDVETRDDNLSDKGAGDVRDGYIAGLAVATRDNAWYFPIKHEGGGNLDRRQVLKWANWCQPPVRPGIPVDGRCSSQWAVLRHTDRRTIT